MTFRKIEEYLRIMITMEFKNDLIQNGSTCLNYKNVKNILIVQK